jgi:hypothetical protein
MLSRLRRRRFDPEFVFVVTYGRSGSTLVQGVLNALPGTLVRGENGFYVRDLFRAARAASSFGEKHGARQQAAKPTSAFYGSGELRPEPFTTSARELAVRLLLGEEDPRRVRHLGFKEVLWHQVEPEETEAFFAWFDDAFPGARYVLNTRNVEAASTSGFWQQYDRDTALAHIARVVEIQEHLRATRPDRVLDVRYEALTGERAASDAELTRLATFVTGGCDAALLDSLRGVLAVGHGPNPFGSSRQDGTRSRG